MANQETLGAGSTVSLGDNRGSLKTQPAKRLKPLEPPASIEPGDKDRKVQIKLRLDKIAEEREKLKKQLEASMNEATRLRKSFEEVKHLRSEKVNEILEEHYLDQSEKKLLDTVLQAEIHEPKLSHLMDNIAKLDAQSEWHRKKLASLSKEEAKLDKELAELVMKDRCSDVVVSMNQIAAQYQAMSKIFERFVFSVQDLISLSESLGIDPHYTERLRRQGLKPWQITIIDSYMSKNLSRQNVLYWLVKVSQFQDEDNIFNAIGQVPRDFKHPAIRDEFTSSRMGRGESQQARLNQEIGTIISQLQ